MLRLFTVYGPGQINMLIPTLIERVRQNQPLQVTGREGLVLSPIFVSDLCSIIRMLLERPDALPAWNIVNVGGDERVSILQLGRMIGDVLNKEPKFEFLSGDEPVGWVADNYKLKNLFKIRTFTSISEGLRQIVESF